MSEDEVHDEDTQVDDSESANPANEDGEAFLQKAKRTKQPVIFSTDDADLQPYLHPKISSQDVKTKPTPYSTCSELCKFDNDAQCVTDCRSYVDSGGDVEKLKSMVTDPSHNEQGELEAPMGDGIQLQSHQMDRTVQDDLHDLETDLDSA